MLLSLMIFIPLLGMIAVLLLPRESEGTHQTRYAPLYAYSTRACSVLIHILRPIKWGNAVRSWSCSLD